MAWYLHLLVIIFLSSDDIVSPAICNFPSNFVSVISKRTHQPRNHHLMLYFPILYEILLYLVYFHDKK